MTNNPKSKPIGLEIIEILLLSASIGLGLLGMMLLIGAPIGGAGAHRSVNTAFQYLFFLVAILAISSFILSIVLATKPVSSKVTWYLLNVLWVSTSVIFFWEIFETDPFSYGAPMSPIFVAIFLLLIVYGLICILIFQTPRVKEYFGFKKHRKNKIAE
jgi:hypothetical protein